MRHWIKGAAAAAVVLTLLPALAVTGGRLAQPEADGGAAAEDRFAGLYMVYSPDGSRDEFYENPNLIEHGSETLDAGEWGSIDIPRQVLPGELDGDGNWTFPGLEGWALYCLETVEDGVPTSAMVSDMADGGYHTTITDEGVTNELSGVVYIGPPEGAPADWTAYDMTGVWTPYFVYQTEDGQPYLDGSGNSSSGGGSIRHRIERSWNRTVDGETEAVTVSAEVQVEAVPRLAAITVYQYGGDGRLLGDAGIPLDGTDQQIPWLEGAQWAVVAETDTTGNGVRTAYDRPGPEEDPASHPFVLLDARGLGEVRTLTLR